MSDHNPSRHEPRDVNALALLMIAGALAATIGIVFFAAWWGFDYSSARNRENKPSAFPLAAQDRSHLPPEPRLEEIDRLEEKKGDMDPSQLQAAQQRRLETYGWVDEERGIVRIPIDRAMKVLVDQKRLPAQSEEPAPTRPSAANSGRMEGRKRP